MNKYLMVLVPLKKTLALNFARVCLYRSLRPLMYGMTTLTPSINFPVHGFGYLLVFCCICLVERTVLGSGSLVGNCEGDSFLLQGIQV